MTVSAHIERIEFGTTDPERAHETMSTMYAAHTPRLHGSRERFRFRIAGAGTDLLRIDDLTHSMALDSRQSAPLDALTSVELLGGRFELSAERTTVTPAVGDVLLCDPYRMSRLNWSDIHVRTVRLDIGATRRIAEELTGLPAARIRFELSEPVSRAAGRYCRSVVQHIGRDVLPHDELLSVPLVRAETFRQLALTFINTFPNTAAECWADRPAPHTFGAEPAVVRRAVEFIDSNAQHDIGLSEVADAARIGPRGLQHAFRKHRGCAPMEYLRRVRLENAHRDLQSADPTRGDTVASIAARWGFLHAGRFSIGYREAYGNSPSDTLRH